MHTDIFWRRAIPTNTILFFLKRGASIKGLWFLFHLLLPKAQKSVLDRYGMMLFILAISFWNISGLKTYKHSNPIKRSPDKTTSYYVFRSTNCPHLDQYFYSKPNRGDDLFIVQRKKNSKCSGYYQMSFYIFLILNVWSLQVGLFLFPRKHLAKSFACTKKQHFIWLKRWEEICCCEWNTKGKTFLNRRQRSWTSYLPLFVVR